MRQDIYEKLKNEYDNRTFLQECKISIPSMYKNNISYIMNYIDELIYGLRYIQYFIYIILRGLFILTSPISFPLGILIARIILRITLKQHEAKSLSDKEIKIEKNKIFLIYLFTFFNIWYIIVLSKVKEKDMASLGNNYGSSSMVRDWKTMYKMAKIVNDTEKMERVIASINRSKYADSTKKNLIKELTK